MELLTIEDLLGGSRRNRTDSRQEQIEAGADPCLYALRVWDQ